MPFVDLLHLAVIAAGLGIGAWSLIFFRAMMPRGRFVLFGVAAMGALFGCAALSGEVGIVSPTAWFFIVIGLMLGSVVAAQHLARARPNET